MLEFIKKQWIAFYVSVAVVIFAIVSMAIYGSNATNEYFESSINGTVLALTIIAVILDIAVVVAQNSSMATNWSNMR